VPLALAVRPLPALELARRADVLGDQVGLSGVQQAIGGYRERFGPDFWTPAPLLEDRARSGTGFYLGAAVRASIIR